MFWDLIQHSEIEEQKEKAVSLEQRVVNLKQELQKTR
jgi:polyhydroxyalkanoate synthesis regulator phasin